MLLRQFVRCLQRRTGFITCATSFLFTNDFDAKKPTAKEKLKLELPDVKKLTHEYMIQQSTVDAVNSATQALTVTYLAIVKTSNEYKVLLNELISLSRETLQFQVSDAHWDMIVDLRSRVQDKKETLLKLTGYVDYVQKMAVAACELSYLSGMENLSATLSKRIDDALQNIREEVNYISTLEQEYCDVQEQCIKNADLTDPED